LENPVIRPGYFGKTNQKRIKPDLEQYDKYQVLLVLFKRIAEIQCDIGDLIEQIIC
jgi:hypothetical protein